MYAIRSYYDRPQECSYALSQPLPDTVGHAMIGTAATSLGIHAGNGNQGFLDAVDDLIDTDLFGRTGQNISPAGSTNAIDDPAATQLDEKLLEIGQRNILAPGNILDGYRRSVCIEVKADHGPHRVLGFGGKTHLGGLPVLGLGKLCLQSLLLFRKDFDFTLQSVITSYSIHYTKLYDLSAWGFALGYVGGGLVLLVAFLMIQFYDAFGFTDRGAASRAGFFLTGLWWLLFRNNFV